MQDLLGRTRSCVPGGIHGGPVAATPQGVDEREPVDVGQLELASKEGRDAAHQTLVLSREGLTGDAEQVAEVELARRPVVHDRGGVALHERLLGEDRVGAR